MGAISDTSQLSSIQQYINSIETVERIKHHPHLIERAPNIEIDDLAAAAFEEVEHAACLRNRQLKIFSLNLLNDSVNISAIAKLDVSNNELSSLPGLSSLINLEVLNIRRNWFGELPSDVGQLTLLKKIDASRNFLKPTQDSLLFGELRKLDMLELLDLRMNQKCRTFEHREFIKENLKHVTGTYGSGRDVNVLISIWQEMSDEKGCIGASAAHRNPSLLRSQLEPWGTVQLRRRLIRDFGMPPSDPEKTGRSEVMESLLDCYRKEGLMKINTPASNTQHVDLNLGVANRRIVKIDGISVRQELLDSILEELRDWRYNAKRGGSSDNRERPSINAKCYLILRAPSKDESNEANSRQEKRRQKKMEHNQTLWNLAMKAIQETDPEFAQRCSEIAVTYGFIGSPHIDRQNSSPFYGLALGNFTEGTGCVAVEMSARVVCEVNTKNRLGKVDGRYPHWVSGYDIENEERYSLIYYDTLSKYQVPGPAIFVTPQE
ncbi:hypothetical protein ACHAWO_013556 [Cyclotella atomus]|uniref:Uncharacterized protein n=1 Tax=Cyclotella atomus TaxID=382360 RepID=A0ABD3N0L2_9STRA